MLKVLWKRWVTPTARRVLAGRLSAREIDEALQSAWNHYRAMTPTLPAEPTVGSRLMVRLAAMTISFYRALLNAGLEEEEALRRTTEVNWILYERTARPTWRTTRLIAGDPLRRVRLAMGWWHRFPYASPGYRMEVVDTEEGVAAYDFLRCPAAETFQRHGLTALGKSAFCDLDFPLAEGWGVVLERPETIMAGAQRCNFRFRPVSSGRTDPAMP